MKAMGQRLRDWIRIISDESFTVSMLMAVTAVSILAFVFGADYELIVGLLFLGAMTAFVETRLRSKTRK